MPRLGLNALNPNDFSREAGVQHGLEFYIDGAWRQPATSAFLDVIDPSTEEAFARVAIGSDEDVDAAVAAARRAFPGFAATSVGERLALLGRIAEIYRARSGELAVAVSREMGAPRALALDAQVPSGLAHIETAIAVLRDFRFDDRVGGALVAHEPIGVVGMITPWNWPLNQIACKVAPALAAGCTMVLKPSEEAPLSALLFASILHEAGVPPGVFNLVNGDGQGVGEAIAAHEDVDMVSFTGSTGAGIRVAELAARTVKRVAQELGGKSPNIVLADADLADAVARGVAACFGNSGQSCNAPTRMLVPRRLHGAAVANARRVAEAYVVGPADASGTVLGPVVSARQFERIQRLIAAGIEEGATLVTGGLGRPPGLDRGYFVRPTIFADVVPEMRIAREEIFGPVLAILPYDTVDEAVEIANDTPYGLAAYVQSADLAAARAVARRLRAGTVRINDPAWDPFAPFGGYGRSGNGREYGVYGLREFLEVKAIAGYGMA